MNARIMHLLAVTCAIVASLLGLSSRAAAADNAKPQPIKLPGIENAFRVTGRILSGSQPENDLSFAALAKFGVKTIISVDGEKPQAEEAKKHGLRYVHLLIGYDGIPATRIAELAKAAAPEAGKIFIHCHHGKHRGPAAVGVICESVAGWTPAQAEAWLRQAGTADDYPGLYRAVREFAMPTAAQLAATGPLPEIAKTPPLVDTMVALDAWLDTMKDELRGDWNAKNMTARRMAGNSVVALAQLLHELARTGDMASRPEDFRRLLADTEKSANAILGLMEKDGPTTTASLHAELKRLTQSCATCHKMYRNEKP